MSSTAMGQIKEGSKAPDFSAQASLNGKAFSFSLKDALKKGPAIVYFYPSAYTPGCNIQAHAFATNMDTIAKSGATVVGVSLDSIDRLNDFSKDPEFCGGKVAVASDVGGKIAKAYGVETSAHKEGDKDSRGVAIDHDFAKRITFVIAPDSTVKAVIGGIGGKENVERAISEVQKLKR